jgi:hypothetical protein
MVFSIRELLLRQLTEEIERGAVMQSKKGIIPLNPPSKGEEKNLTSEEDFSGVFFETQFPIKNQKSKIIKS